MSDSIPNLPHVILCDMCIEEDRKPARKTCMKCEISMCVNHLQAHLTTPVLLQTHTLTDPMVMDGTTKCPQHGKLLEYYCLDDMACVCVSCAIEGQHRVHNMKTLPTAHRDLVEKLNADNGALKVKTDGVNSNLGTWEKNETEKVRQSGVRLVEAVNQLRDLSIASVQSSVSSRLASIKTAMSGIEAVLQEKDDFKFLQRYAQVHRDVEKAMVVDLRQGLEPGAHRDKLVDELQQEWEKTIMHAGNFWLSVMTLVDPENQHEAASTPSDLTFDPKTLGRGFSLSEDRRKLFYSSWMGELNARVLHIQSSVPDSNLEMWAISLPKSCDWTVGLCDANYKTNFMNGEVCALRCEDDILLTVTTETFESGLGMGVKVVTTPITDEGQKLARPNKVEVVHDETSQSLSFFSLTEENQRKKIVTVEIRTLPMQFCPFVCLGKVGLQRNTMQQCQMSALTFGTGKTQSLFGASTQHQQDQNKWQCHCGVIHQYQGSTYLRQSTCSCGVVIGSSPVTQVLCELL